MTLRATDKTRSIAKKVVEALVKKNVLMVGSQETDKINNVDIHDTYKDFYLIEKEYERSCFKVYNEHPVDETHLVVVRRLIH